MSTVFDVVTVVSFLGLVLSFFLWTDRETRTLMQFMVSAILFAVANQIGNAGHAMFGFVLLAAGIGYAVLITWRSTT